MKIEQVLKQIITLRVMLEIRDWSIAEKQDRVAVRKILERETDAVYGPILEAIQKLGRESGVELAEVGGIALPDTIKGLTR